MFLKKFPLLCLAGGLLAVQAVSPLQEASAARPGVEPLIPDLPQSEEQEASAPSTGGLQVDAAAIEAAMREAAAQFRPVLLIFTSNSPRLRARELYLLTNRRVAPFYEDYTMLRCDAASMPGLAARFGVRRVPTWIRLDTSGKEDGRRTGLLDVGELVEFLERLYAGERPAISNDGATRELSRLINQPEQMTEGDWLGISEQLADPELRPLVIETFRELDPYPALSLWRMLQYPRLPVRLAALELLEDRAGTNFGFDPWKTVESQTEALEQWKAWIIEGEKADTPQLEADQKTVMAFVSDLLSDDLGKEQRGRTGLIRLGIASLPHLQAVREHGSADLTAGGRARLREIEAAVQLQHLGVPDAAGTAQRLIFGDVNTRIAALQTIAEQGQPALPIIRPSLNSDDSLEREAGVETLAMAGGKSVDETLIAHAAQETDANVLHVLFRQLSQIATTPALEYLAGQVRHEQEDLAVGALEGLRLARSKQHTEAIAGALEDPRWRVRVAALEALAVADGGDYSEAIQARFNDPDPFVRISAIQTAGRLRLQEAGPQLVELFQEDPPTRPAIIATLAAGNRPVPAEILETFSTLKPEAMLQVMGAIESVDATTLPLIRIAASQENADVSMAALRVAARTGVKQEEPAYGVLIDALKSGDPRKAQAVAETLEVSKYELRKIQPFVERERYGSGNAALAPPKNPGTEGLLGAVFKGFLGDKKEAGGYDELRLALRALLDSGQSREQAGIALVQLGDPYGLKVFDSPEFVMALDETSRLRLARALAHTPVDGALPVAAELLKDPQKTVRQTVARNLIQSPNLAPRNVILEALNTPGHPLKPADVYSSQFGMQLEGNAARKTWQDQMLAWAEDTSLPSSLRVIGIYGLHYNLVGDDNVSRLKDLLKADDPYVRRAAADLLGLQNPSDFLELAPELAADQHPLVREVVTAYESAGGRQWEIHLDAKETKRDYRGSYSSTKLAAAPESIVTLWRKLAKDPVPDVRYRAMTALIRHRQPVDIPAFMAMAANRKDSEALLRDVFSRGEEVPETYAGLLPLINEEASYYANAKLALGLSNDTPESLPATGPALPAPSPEVAPAVESQEPAEQAPVQLVYFYKPGCHECEEVEAMLGRVQETLPELQVERFNINKHRSMELNEWLAGRQQVPDTQRLVAPALFTANDYLIRDDISEERIAALAMRARGATLQLPDAVSEPEVAKEASAAIAARYQAIHPGVIVAAGFFDGLNPCAFATIIFLLSYLQVAKRSPREILQIGLAYLAGVFCTYFLLGLGLTEIVSRLVVFRKLAMVMNLAMGLFALVVAVLSLRDGWLCLRGRMGEMTLQLPDAVKNRIHGVIRSKARHHRFVAMAFGVGAFISVLELACTGQVYAPTILYMLQAGEGSAVGYLLLYNLAFVVPLAAVFAAAFYGMTSEALVGFMRRHAAWVKFGLAGVFLMLALLLIAREL